MVPKPLPAGVEMLLAIALLIIAFNLQVAVFTFGPAPWLAGIGALSFWWRGPSLWRGAASRAVPAWRVVALGLGVGVAYQLVGTFAIGPVLARLTSGQLPDASAFALARPLAARTASNGRGSLVFARGADCLCRIH